MANPNRKLKRPDGLGKLYRYQTAGDEEEKIFTLPVEKLLDDNYVYLLREIKKEDYFIQDNDTCFFFKEVVSDEEVVGFAAYKPSNIDNKSLVMQYFYVLPEYRGRGLLEEELDEATTLFESSILIEYPTYDMVESLIKHRLARVFDDRFVISRIPFFIPIVPVADAVNGVFREEYVYDDKVYRKLSLIYDLELCAVVGLASDDIGNDMTDKVEADKEDNMNNFNVLSLPLHVDDDKYGCVKKRENDADIIDNTYFDKVKKVVEDNDSVIQNWLTLM